MLARIAIHGLPSISGNSIYDARDPNTINLVPTGSGSNLVLATDFFARTCQFANRHRETNPETQFLDRHRYLTLLQNQRYLPCLSDKKSNVISIPPLTNAQRTELSPSTESIFIEITSGHSMKICYRVMNLFLLQILRLELGKKTKNSNTRQRLALQQTRVVNEQGQLIRTFPSRGALNWSGISKEIIFLDQLTTDQQSFLHIFLILDLTRKEIKDENEFLSI